MIERMRKAIMDVIQPLLPPAGENIALVDFPNHANVGDSAIWLGEQGFLQQNGFRNKIYTCEVETYSKGSLADAVGPGTIFLHGGGNLGDLWESHQEFRERIITDFPENRIIQLPQSIWFRHQENLLRARDVFNQHSDLTILVRDTASLDVASSQLCTNTLLCPDMAFWLGPVNMAEMPTAPCIWLQRNDKESSTTQKHIHRNGIWPYDWSIDEVTPAIKSNILLLHHNTIETDPERRDVLRKNLSSIYPQLAQERVIRGCKILARGQMVVTERLHGHILCLLMGVPHHILDTRYGKIRNFTETWEYHSPLMNWCHSEKEALDLVAG